MDPKQLAVKEAFLKNLRLQTMEKLLPQRAAPAPAPEPVAAPVTDVDAPAEASGEPADDELAQLLAQEG